MIRLIVLLLPLGLSACAALQSWFEPPAPCQQAEYRQFDFWLGDWSVRRTDAPELVATNRVGLIMQGCAIREQYATTTGYEGESLSWFDPELGQWRQSWIDNAGTLLQLSGGLNAEGSMVLQGRKRQDERGHSILDRITWTPRSDGTVLQVWESFNDSTQTWQLVFKGVYRRRGAGTKREL